MHALERLERAVARGGGVDVMLRLMRAYEDMGLVRPEHLLSGLKLYVAWALVDGDSAPASLALHPDDVSAHGALRELREKSPREEWDGYVDDVRVDHGPDDPPFLEAQRSRQSLLAEVGGGRAPAAVVSLLRFEESRLGVARIDEASPWLRPKLNVHVSWRYVGWKYRVDAFSTGARYDRWILRRVREVADAVGVSEADLEARVRRDGVREAFYYLAGMPEAQRWSPGVVRSYLVGIKWGRGV